ncbi:DUF6875 domain-containing protein [Brasilonema sp. UFV-L1]|uniref:DUF6875 domain-containing protein n=1 Tax=Brasilonema sp. UFV-L1 TaxID=2234130 RepID=UPI0030DDA54F
MVSYTSKKIKSYRNLIITTKKWSTMVLFTPIEIDQIQQDLPYLINIMQWVQNFLAKPHPDLGRSGPVCPFVPQSVKSNSIQLGVIHAKNLEPQQVEEIMLRHRDIFLELEPKDRETAINKAILLIFPGLDIEEISKLIDGVQQKLKPFFIESGLMIGEFHKCNETSGLHNQNFRPLRSPVPILAIRFMVESDLPFLVNAENPSLRIKYLEAYLQSFGNKMRDHKNLNKARQALALAQEQIQQENF